ncbi:chemotaxis protein CheW [Methylobacillus gramineus]|uniref:chemotaxis protein CheW n=1 Tax=Methylobacillus gramineus TaxID=755169 RepID=UPI001CFF9AC0|nr:chemotaxis protein CheW [Methylobacillus gramineus]MCB5184084.1 chemotaxis protein CheW [Methylobacillus gramineus]
MANPRLNLQAYQQNILDRLKSVATDQEATVSRLGVYAGGERYLISLRDISEVLPVPDILSVPLTQPWFLGMTNVRGNLYAISDLARLVGITRHAAQITAESRILLIHGDFEINAGFLVDGLAGLRNISELKALELVADVPGWTIASYEDDNNHKWEALDIGLLLNKKEFMQVAA